VSDFHEEAVSERMLDRRLLRRLFGYLRPHRASVAFAGVLVLLDSLIGLLGPYLTKQAIDHGIRHRDRVFLDEMALVYLATIAVGLGLGYLHLQVLQRIGQQAMVALRLDLFRKLQRLPVGYFDRNPTGRVMTRVTNDVDALNELFTAGVVGVFGDLCALIGIVVAMISLNAELLAVTFSVLPLIVIVTLLFRSRIRRSFRDVRGKLARMNGFLNENVGGMATVQILNREARSFEAFRRVNGEHRDANLRAVFIHALFFPALELVAAIAVSLIVWYGGRQVMWTGITLGTLVAFIQYTQRFFRPISDLSEKYGILQQAMASAERIFGLLDTSEDPMLHRRAAAPAVKRPFLGRVEFDRVWFAYRDDHWVLQDVSFTIAPGEKVAVVGATGSGKTTLTNLLLGFYQPQRGTIRVDGRDLREWDIRELRRHFAISLQDVFLFTGSVESNLRMGQPDLTRADIERAVREVHVDRSIARLPQGLDTEVRERGATLSGGERQLLTFARALARNPEILILDEATSAVDTGTELLIQDALRRLLVGRTALVIAHRLSTIQDVDRILVLHHGRIRESGTHAELLGTGGIYARLYELQYFGGNRKAAARRPDWEEEDVREPQILDAGPNVA